MVFDLLDQGYFRSRRADTEEQALIDEYEFVRRCNGKPGRLPEATLLAMVVNQRRRMEAPAAVKSEPSDDAKKQAARDRMAKARAARKAKQLAKVG